MELALFPEPSCEDRNRFAYIRPPPSWALWGSIIAGPGCEGGALDIVSKDRGSSPSTTTYTSRELGQGPSQSELQFTRELNVSLAPSLLSRFEGCLKEE